ncbi:MAG: ABC transporter ATP-binding protein [Pseudomonadota bacterium]
MKLLEVSALRAGYRDTVVVKDLSFDLESGQLVSLLGPSGCGKTTLLRALAGFVPALSGEIRLQGRVASSETTHIPPEARQLGMVFQDHALFPHLSVRQNLEFGLRRIKGSERGKRVSRLLEMTDLGALEQRFPHELSGGQQQRVALARALAPEPGLILLDEPFSNLDTELRERLAREVAEILRAAGIAGILVTHDQDEAFALAERVGVMFGGQIDQWDTPFRLYHEPANRAIANFVGQGVFVPGSATSAGIQTDLGVLANPAESVSGDVDVLIRPDAVVPNDAGPIEARVLSRAFRGTHILYELAVDGQTLLSLFPSDRDHKVGDVVGVALALDRLVTFPR